MKCQECKKEYNKLYDYGGIAPYMICSECAKRADWEEKTRMELEYEPVNCDDDIDEDD